MDLQSNTEPKHVEAAGGYVIRPTDDGISVLMIFRRGVWDLPKGKVNPGETPAGCALREVAEETGAAGLAIQRGVGMTLHTYVEHDATVLKTTWWFLMSTTSNEFKPQKEEQIERVEWIPWDRARTIAGYENLRRHMRSVDEAIREESGTGVL